jgi:acetyl esterase/lipase
VLKYRLGLAGYHYPVEFEDGTRAMRWVRAHAADYKIDPHRVGIMGSSAGGHMASMQLTHFDSGNPNSDDPVERQSSRPDLGILCYPVITMGEFAHQGSKDNLLGKHPSDKLVKRLSSELQVTTNTPPCFIWCTYEDKTVPVENSLMFAEALRKNHVPFDLHIYQKGGHGMGLKDKPPFAHPHPWAGDCLFWLTAQDFVE